jgi:Ca2+-binding EF-hand superfamily protein
LYLLHADLKDAFVLFDVNNEGYINHVKLFNGMRAFGYNPTEAEVQDMILAVNNDGEVV